MGLYVPEPPARPGEPPNFGSLVLVPPGAVPRPAVDVAANDIRDLAFSLIRVLDEGGRAQGPWNPALDSDVLVKGLRTMLLTRAFDERMHRAQRTGKTGFYLKCTGEEAVGCAQAMAIELSDMCFTSYRQQGVLIARGYPLVDMINQIYNNAQDPLKGRQLPVLYSSREYGYWPMSGNVGTRFPHAVGWAMACAYKGDPRIAAAWIGEGATAEGDFHHALTFASVYRAPVILNIVNNQWAISSFQGIAGGEAAPFAARGVGYGLPAFRVDGNDFLAVYSVTRWSAERARRGLGATLIELYTYRAEAHSTSDDPSRYRPRDEADHWPLGDPISRLKDHLIALGVWSDETHEACRREAEESVRAAARAAEKVGTLGTGSRPPTEEMFLDVYKAQDWRLKRQSEELRTLACQP